MAVVYNRTQPLSLRLPNHVDAASLLQPGRSTGKLFRSVALMANDAGDYNGGGLGAFPADANWHDVSPIGAATAAHPWDAAHELAARSSKDSNLAAFAEPNLLQDFRNLADNLSEVVRVVAPKGSPEFNKDWGPVTGLAFGWHLEDGFSQLRTARDQIGDTAGARGRRVRIGHLDTGYDENHHSTPLRFKTEMAYNCVDDNQDARAPARAGGLIPDPSHGTATLALLAGKQVPEMLNGDFIGGAPYAEIVPIRIGNSWLHIWDRDLADGIFHAIGAGCDVVSISAGGLPTRRWADAVNAAYDAGVSVFCASGDNIGGWPTRLTIYPARFHRVTSVCGVTHEWKPYFDAKYNGNHTKAEGNWGPNSAMATAISAFSPNVPWARYGKDNFEPDGSGTSSSTPQVAAAAALWAQKNIDGLMAIEGWQRVEAIRRALFTSAKQSNGDRAHLGWGVLQAADALTVKLDTTGLKKLPPDKVGFALIKVLFPISDKARRVPSSANYDRQEMLEVEAAQIAMADPAIAKIIADADVATDDFSSSTRNDLIDAFATSPSCSETLRSFFAGAPK